MLHAFVENFVTSEHFLRVMMTLLFASWYISYVRSRAKNHSSNLNFHDLPSKGGVNNYVHDVLPRKSASL